MRRRLPRIDPQTENWLNRQDYGSNLRDAAALVTLASESGAAPATVQAAVQRVEASRAQLHPTSTQEDAWLLLAASAMAKDSGNVTLDVNGEAVQRALYRTIRANDLKEPVKVTNTGDTEVKAVVTVTGAPLTPEPAAENGFRIERLTYTPDGDPVDAAQVKQNTRLVVVLKITEAQPQFGRVIVADYLPAGFEIDNPHLVSSGDTGTLAWITDAVEPANTEFRDDRFTAAFERKRGDPAVFTVAYVVRAVSPGTLCAAAGGRRGHVPAGSLRPHRQRQHRGHGGEMMRKKTRLILAGVFVCVSAFAGAAWWVASLGPPPLGKNLDFSTTVVDREGRLLRAYATSEGRWRLPATVADVDPRFFDVLFAYEDKRFRSHHGVDPRAVLRATLQFATSGQLRSGASTLTMQVARLLEPPEVRRSMVTKLRQMVRAVEIERALSKDEILALYLDLAPYGGNIEGIRAASLAYFGKEPRRLSLGEAALLVALPQSPELRRPDRFAESARAARDRVLDRFAATGTVPADEIALAKTEPVPTGRRPMPLLAPHVADKVVAEPTQSKVHRLTIDAVVQKNLENLARERVRALAATLGPDVSLAILAVDNATGEILASVGSPDYFDLRRAGQIDMTQALRSPGSTLKPFIYGFGFEDGVINPETLIEDRPVAYGSYAPKDFDSTFQGTVTVRKALQLSLNVPAIAVLDEVGSSRLTAQIGQAGASLVLPPGEAPGLAIGLGGVGIKLSDLVHALCRPCAPRHDDAAQRAFRRAAAAGAAADGAGRRLVCRQRADRLAAAGERHAGPHRVQDRHQLRLPRRLVDWL